MSQDLPVSLMKLFFWWKAKFLVLGLPSWSAGLPGFLNYWMADERNFAVHTSLMLSIYMCSAALSTAIVSVLMFNFILKGLNLACSGTYPYNYILYPLPVTPFCLTEVFSEKPPPPPTHTHTHTHNVSDLHFKHSRQLLRFFISRKNTGSTMKWASNVACLMFSILHA